MTVWSYQGCRSRQGGEHIVAIPVVSKVGKMVFGTRNERMVKRYLHIVEEVSARDDEIR